MLDIQKIEEKPNNLSKKFVSQVNLPLLKEEVIKKYQELADTYSKHGQSQVAIKYQLTAIAINPKNKQSYIDLGESLIQLKEYKKAIVVFKYLYSQDAESYTIQFKLAQAYYKNKQIAQACMIWENLNKKFPQKKEPTMLLQLSASLKAM